MTDKYILIDEDNYGEDVYRVFFKYGKKENYLYFFGFTEDEDCTDDNFEFYIDKSFDADFCEYIVKYFNNSYSSLLNGLKTLFTYTEVKKEND